MKVMNLGSEDDPVAKKKSSNRKLKIALGLAAVILVPTIGRTLAGTITLNTSNSVEFGQGVLTTAACDSDGITVTPASLLVSGAFRLETITVSGVATGCTAKYLTFKVLDSSNVAQVISSGSNTTLCKVLFVTATPSVAQDSCPVVSSSTSTGFTMVPSVHPAANSVSVITLESSAT